MVSSRLGFTLHGLYVSSCDGVAPTKGKSTTNYSYYTSGVWLRVHAERAGAAAHRGAGCRPPRTQVLGEMVEPVQNISRSASRSVSSNRSSTSQCLGSRTDRRAGEVDECATADRGRSRTTGHGKIAQDVWFTPGAHLGAYLHRPSKGRCPKFWKSLSSWSG